MNYIAFPASADTEAPRFPSFHFKLHPSSAVKDKGIIPPWKKLGNHYLFL
jgi:hypothetical protein